MRHFALGIFFALINFAGQARTIQVRCLSNPHDAALLNHSIGDSQTGDQILIGGTCQLNQTVVLLGDRSYLGESRTGTILRQADGASLPALVASDSWYSDSTTTGDPVRIAHLTLDGNANRNSGTNSLVIRSWQTVIEDLQIENSPGDGLQITNTSRNGTELQNTQVNGRISDCFITNSGGNGIHIVDSGNSVTDWDLLDSWVASSGLSGINMDNAAGWKIRGVHLYGVPQNAIYANRCFGTTIQDNYIEDFGGSSAGGQTWYGIACTLQGGVGSVITGNKVFQFGKEGPASNLIFIGVPQVNYGTGIVNVVNNVIVGTNAANEIGLSYQTGNAPGLQMLSANNNVQSVVRPRVVGPKVGLVSGY
jgi:hypothetical protein